MDNGEGGTDSEGESGEESSEEGGEEASGEETGDDELVIATGADMVTFDIHDHNNTSTEAIHVNMFNYLVKTDGEGGFVPDLATEWENVDDTTWNFTLRDDVKFHNGEDFTAEDVKYTLERVANDDSLLEHGNYNQISEVNVLGDYEVEIVTESPEPAMLNRLSRLGSGMLPSQYIEENGFDHFLEEPVGTGPYQYVEWVRDDRVVLEPAENYFGEEAQYSQLTFRAIPEDSTRVSELITGGVDIATNIPPNDWERIEEEEGLKLGQSPTQRVMMLIMRTGEGEVTSDQKVREAIDLAIDNEAIVESLYEGAATPTRTRVTPGNTGANKDLYDTSVYDPEKAKELLAEAGYEDGVEINFAAPSGRYLKDRESAELIQAMLSEVGITANLEFKEWSSFVENYTSKTFDEMFMIGYGNSMFDAALALDRLTQDQNEGETDYMNEEVEELLNEAESNMDPEERVEQYQRVQEIIAEERPQIYLYQLDAVVGMQSNVDFEPRLDEMIYVKDITKE
ncbi:peptide ABC transporter substrate-binding protein [Halalkalibacillus sediminis]|uniref:Peptide ABC transporter substrate-binding protein n=2 Tax=Halalkalibacillus sediminis TaxID=2018042 RepID=A0A2I0QUZ6_9BACI|nr:peptide ABC transporter substrate-binding protein [Halalkalibacillus sediminis]